MRPFQAWVGVTDDHLALEYWPATGNDAYERLYQTRKEALKHYQCVVKVIVVAVDEPYDKGSP